MGEGAQDIDLAILTALLKGWYILYNLWFDSTYKNTAVDKVPQLTSLLLSIATESAPDLTNKNDCGVKIYKKKLFVKVLVKSSKTLPSLKGRKYQDLKGNSTIMIRAYLAFLYKIEWKVGKDEIN